jgi:class 3 adenylate cyclase
VLCAAAIVVILLQADNDKAALAFPGLLLFVVGFVAFNIVPFPVALSIGGAASLSYVASLALMGSMPMGVTMALGMGAFSALLIGSVECYLVEMAAREGFYQRAIIEKQAAALGAERDRSERLLLNILPAPIAERLKDDEGTIADSFENVTVLFADIAGFTEYSGQVPPVELVHRLNTIFSAFDDLAETHGLEKIKTIGDAYMVAGGLPAPGGDHASGIADMALDMLAAMHGFNSDASLPLELRIGINSGPVTAGVIGRKKFIYDLWGDAVNTASRMESHGIVGRIQVTEATYNLLRARYTFESREPIEVKGKGTMSTWFLIGRK